MSAGDSPLGLRLAQCLPAATFELEALVRLVGIEETTSVPTASVTCRGRARLLINPDFVAEYCARDEHLFLLVMHELWHVLLGHTTLYPRTTLGHNIAFDALINAGLARQHPDHAYRGFFEALNPADRFPGLLLRPPVGWPHNANYAVTGPPGTERAMRYLYPLPGTSPPEPTYQELLDLIAQATAEDDAPPPVMLGGHDDDDDSSPLDDPLFGDVVRRIVEKWPPPPVPMGGRDSGGRATESWVSAEPSDAALRAEFIRLVRRLVTPSHAGARERRRHLDRVLGGPGPLPNAADRLLPAKKALGAGALLTAQSMTMPTTTPDTPTRTLVYLDVSGSMGEMLPRLVDLLVGPARRRLIDVMQFSTVVRPLSVADLTGGKLTTTQGTVIDCVLEHVLTRPERRALILTDGYVGEPATELATAVHERGTRIHIAIPEDGWTRDLTGLGEITRLPGLI